jgi:hypothetical protein
MNKYKMLGIVHRAMTEGASTGEVQFRKSLAGIELINGVVFCLDDRLKELWDEYNIISRFDNGTVIFHT